MSRIIVSAIAACLAAVPSASAFAHAHLKGQTPAADAAVPPPAAVTLQFTEALEVAFSGVVLTGPDGSVVATGPASLAAGDPSRLIVPVTGRVAPGAYQVRWHAVAADGHKTGGTYRFTVVP